MGAGAIPVAIASTVKAASDEELQSVLNGLAPASRQTLSSVLSKVDNQEIGDDRGVSHASSTELHDPDVSDPSAKSDLTVLLLNGEIVHVDITGAKQIADVRRSIAINLQVAPSRVKLLCGDAELEDKSDCSVIPSEDQLLVILLPSPVRVLCRVRPFSAREQHLEQQRAVWRLGTRNISVNVNDSNETFGFSAAFDSGSQEEIFSFCADAVAAATSGVDACILAYGQTGAGKTYTMYGPDLTDPVSCGIVPRFARALFACESVEEVTVSMLENGPGDRLLDLLCQGGGRQPEVKLRLAKGGKFLKENATEVRCRDANEVINCIEQAFHNRRVEATMMSHNGRRSNLLANFKVTCASSMLGEPHTSNVVLGDLAGSERPPHTDASVVPLKEAAWINRSLTSFVNVLSAYCEGSKFIPYRDSKLAMILKDCLQNIFVIVVCSPAACNVEEILRNFREANRMQAQ